MPTPDPVQTTPDPVRTIADTVLYEGYILWPYRRSALKNQRRFTFGGIYPPAHSALHPDDPDAMQTEVLLQGDRDAAVEVTLRFLHVVQRGVARVSETGRLEAVDELVLGSERHLAWEEAVEREVRSPRLTMGELAAGHVLGVAIAPERETEELCDDEGRVAGAVIRTWRGLSGRLELDAHEVRTGLWRVCARVVNLTEFSPGGLRQEALERTFCSSHTLLRARGGAFVSLTDPPAEHAAAAAACENLGTWPVLVGETGDQTTILSSPIILEDYPRVAPESPGDLFDGGEIDQLLILSILALSDEEKEEMRASDPRAREILERTESLTPDQLMALHGAIREFGMAR